MTDAEFAANYSKRSLQEDSNGDFFFKFIAITMILFVAKILIDVVCTTRCGG